MPKCRNNWRRKKKNAKKNPELKRRRHYFDFRRIRLPLIRRIYPVETLAERLVTVQPMQPMRADAALLFYLRYRYSENKGLKRSYGRLIQANLDSWKEGVQKRASMLCTSNPCFEIELYDY